MTIAALPLISLLDLLFPERCLLCGAASGEESWCLRGARVPGLRFWDSPHLCIACSDALPTATVASEVGEGHPGRLNVFGAAATNPDLVKLVGQFKYHGVRGLAWPLGRLLSVALQVARASGGDVDALIPVPLHPGRRRARGFNQAEILTRVLLAGGDLEAETKVLVRRQKTSQQARIVSTQDRMRNLADCFRAARPPGEGIRIGLVDDLVTSGWTCVSAAARLREAGWDVRWALTLGLAAHPKKGGTRIDTWEIGF
jgi:predicted amidophosphoribosyltransferase